MGIQRLGSFVGEVQEFSAKGSEAKGFRVILVLQEETGVVPYKEFPISPETVRMFPESLGVCGDAAKSACLHKDSSMCHVPPVPFVPAAENI